ncbi:MAG: ribosome assembly RNA-binding protein YhbY [Woeseia sp.]
MHLGEKQKKFLRGLGHKLKPVVTVGGSGITDALLREFDSTIAHHELIKVRFRATDREQRDRIIEELSDRGKALLVGRTGNTALLYRENPDEPRIHLPRD